MPVHPKRCTKYQKPKCNHHPHNVMHLEPRQCLHDIIGSPLRYKLRFLLLKLRLKGSKVLHMASGGLLLQGSMIVREDIQTQHVRAERYFYPRLVWLACMSELFFFFLEVALWYGIVILLAQVGVKRCYGYCGW